MSVEEKVLDKIKALFRMAEHPNSNPNEAAVAMEKATKLLLEHNLSRASIDVGTGAVLDASVISHMDFTEQRNNFSWSASLLSCIARHNLCKVVQSEKESKIHIFGNSSNRDVVIEMYVWVRLQLQVMADTAWSSYIGPQTKAKYLYEFYFGAINIINDRLKKPYQEFTGTPGGNALVVYNDRALQVAARQMFPNLSAGHRRSINRGDGYYSGQDAGRNASFSKPGSIGSPRALGSG